MKIILMEHCQVYDFQWLGRLTLKQCDLIIKSMKLKQKNELEKLKMQAWLNQQVKATRKSGKKSVPRYSSYQEFSQCFKIKDELEKKPEDDTLHSMIARANTKKS